VLSRGGLNATAKRDLTVNITYWARRPHLVLARARYWAWEKQNPDKPWLCPEAVSFCAQTLTKSMRALEFGSGRSTAWFARHVGHLTSVEQSEAWFERVSAELERQGLDNIDYRLIPLDHPATEPEHEVYDPLPAYVAAFDTFPDESLDFLVIDGHYRTACLRVGLPKLKPGGLLLVDDVNMWGTPAQVPIPEGWPLVHQSDNGLKITCVWRKPG
jgi:hypothetical protein